ncbi:flagellar hook-length control protein FliK [Nocardioides sp. J54]|uniref:flagellar hook-length control protein FliK n=1 Tax=Nocardioides sp. J54 TaxID=935866 RepID=UPI0004912EA4|nr:flagellar hook-length control protein FliK [Nocardioides sp. J54]
MSIAPFLPGLPAATAEPGTGAAPGGPGPTAEGTAASAFGDALAAALAGTAAGCTVATVPPAPAPVTGPATVPAPPLEPSPAPVQPVLLPVEASAVAVDASLVAVDASLVAVEASLPTLAQTPQQDAPAGRRTTGEALPGGPAGPAGPAGLAGAGRDASTVTTDVSTATADASTVTSDVSAVSGVGGAAATAGGTALDLAPEKVTRAVVQQVFPEVTRMASTAGNGTHRITLTLQPEQLGEVRVTLVVRDGSVQVRLAGGDGAEGAAVHRALASGAPELQRLLERTGAEARVSVRDPFAPLLPTTAATAGASTTTGQGAGPQSGPQAGPDAHARQEAQARQEQGGGQPGRDQPRDEPRQQQPARLSYPIAPTPLAGRLDRTV